MNKRAPHFRLLWMVGLLLLCRVASASKIGDEGPYVAHSGDVDRNRTLNSRDALMIYGIIQGFYDNYPDQSGLRAAADVNSDGIVDAHDVQKIFDLIGSNPNDSDGDGVPNAQDSAPLDERFAFPQAYYLDFDQDMDGNRNFRESSNTLRPEPQAYVSWCADPDDFDPLNIQPAVAKGDRIIGVDLGSTWQPDLLRDLGAEATTLNLYWSQIESAPGVFNGPQAESLDFVRQLYVPEGIKVSLTVSPISRNQLILPADLKSRIESEQIGFDDPEMIARFNALLDRIHEKLAGVPLVALQIGDDVDQFYSVIPDAQFWTGYKNFYDAVTNHARALWGLDLSVGITATSDGLTTGPTRTLMATINQNSSHISVTYFPHNFDFTAVDPERVVIEIEQLVQLASPRPLYIQATGYPSAAISGSSPVRQSQFIKAVFEVWDRWPFAIPFICFHAMNDISYGDAIAQAQQRPDYILGLLPNMAAYLQSMGLVAPASPDEPKKPAFKSLQDAAFERGWWRPKPHASRPFLMGFTSNPYDSPTSLTELGTVSAWMRDHFSSESEIVNLHFDAGIPWVEAYNDDFSSPTPPYSNDLLQKWAAFKQQIVPGSKVLVSITPIGIPRNQLASYWGYGESFTFQESGGEFVRVGTGQFSDGNDRLPPGPWATYAFDDPHVKHAFLNYAKRVIQYFNPDYLCIAIETDALLVQSVPKYDKYFDLHRYVYNGLKSNSAYRNLPIFVSFSLTSFMADEYGVALKSDEYNQGVMESQYKAFADFMPYTDIVGFSYYPHFGKFNANRILPSMFDRLFAYIATTGKPLAVTEMGFPAEQFDILGTPFLGSEDKQLRFLRMVFERFTNMPNPVPFIINYEVRDNDYTWNRLAQDPNANPTFVEFYKYFRDIGIYDGDGFIRPAGNFWNDTLAVPRVERHFDIPANAIPAENWIDYP